MAFTLSTTGVLLGVITPVLLLSGKCDPDDEGPDEDEEEGQLALNNDGVREAIVD